MGDHAEAGDFGEIVAKFEWAIRSLEPTSRAALLHVLELPDSERAAAIGSLHERGITPSLVELLIDLHDQARVRRWLASELKIADRYA
jgi:hypothetical protein